MSEDNDQNDLDQEESSEESSAGAHDHLNEGLVCLDDLVSNLEAKLVPVLSPTEPESEPEDEEPESETSALRGAALKLDSLNERLSTLLEQIDL